MGKAQERAGRLRWQAGSFYGLQVRTNRQTVATPGIANVNDKLDPFTDEVSSGLLVCPCHGQFNYFAGATYELN